MPDVTRSGYFPNQPQREPGPEFVEEPSESEVSLDEEDNVQDLRAEEAAADQVVPPWAELVVQDPDALVYVRHITSRKLHRLADESGNRLKCGKACARKFERLSEKPRFMADMCLNCFK